MTIGVLYVGLLIVGTVYALISGVMGWLSDLGGGDIHVDASGHLDAGHLHPISGTTVATFVTGFGAGGVIAQYLLRWSLGAGLGLALGSGIFLAAAAFGVLELIFSQTQVGSEFAMEEIAGREAEVITAIPSGGVGEIAYLARGQREVAAARASDGGALHKGSLVVIDKTAGATVYVRAKSPQQGGAAHG